MVCVNWDLKHWKNENNDEVLILSWGLCSFNNGLNNSSSNSLPPFSDSKPHPLLARHRHYKFNHHLDTVTRHNHLRLLILIVHDSRHFPRHISSPKKELRPIPCEKGRMPPTLFLLQHINYG
ncbi:hypothetical protein RHGRI_024421 [Rhododendron griersonianum]|uniref:Uncharacterized protein n=1 Tax=Rhododendron griersonianum TaxID=479676 RepID=A0AAV6J7A4_9ERIC|nr:hypothetical protein RHGRI_024421 [Rhododendron griersonianum]